MKAKSISCRQFNSNRMHSTSSADKTNQTAHLRHLHSAKRISCRHFAHLQRTYIRQKSFYSGNLHTCKLLTSGKNHFMQAVCTLTNYLHQEKKIFLQAIFTLATHFTSGEKKRKKNPPPPNLKKNNNQIMQAINLHICNPLTSGQISMDSFHNLQY